VKKVNRKVLVTFVVLMAAAMLATPLISCAAAKPTVKSVVFRLETWPANPELADYSKFKYFECGESENVMLLRLPTDGVPPLLDFVPTLEQWNANPFLYLEKGGIRLIIDGVPMVGVAEQMVINCRVGTGLDDWDAAEKWTFTFAEGTLELSAVSTSDGLGTCIGTRGTGYFEGAKFMGTFTSVLYPYDLYGTGVELKVQVGTGELMM
jgi:hypothetical protein